MYKYLLAVKCKDCEFSMMGLNIEKALVHSANTSHNLILTASW